MVHKGNVPLEWSEKNVIVRAPESNPATSAPKRSRGKSPSSEDKPKKVRRRRASTKKPKDGSPKPPTVVQSGFGVASATKSGVLAAVSVSTPSPLKQYRRKTSAGRVKILKSLEEVFSQSPYLLTSFLSFFFFFFAFIFGTNHMFLLLQQSSDNEETQLEEYDFEDTAADFDKLLFLEKI